MLIQFTVSNFTSYKDKKILSLKPIPSIKEHKDRLIFSNKEEYLPSTAIYGANASGKSNLTKALTCAILMIRNSHLQQVNMPTGIIPFLLDEKSKKYKTSMEFIFVQNDIKYVYGFICDSKCIYEEYLYKYNSRKPTLIFERTNVNNYEYNSPEIKKELKTCETKNLDNMLFLSTATQWNCKSTRDAYQWFIEKIDTYSPEMIKNNIVNYLDINKNNKELKPFLLNIFKHADINITDYVFESKKMDPEKVQLPPINGLDEKLINSLKQNAIEYKLTTNHKVNVDGVEKEYTLDISQESMGTQTLLGYGINIINALKKGKTMVVDEIETSLHPMLVRYIVGLFNDKESNPNGAQLVFTTHDVNLLDLDLFRRDQIYFVEKDESGTSDLYSLSEYSPRKDENIRKGYMQGRYGAIPYIESGVEWSER